MRLQSPLEGVEGGGGGRVINLLGKTSTTRIILSVQGVSGSHSCSRSSQHFHSIRVLQPLALLGPSISLSFPHFFPILLLALPATAAEGANKDVRVSIRHVRSGWDVAGPRVHVLARLRVGLGGQARRGDRRCRGWRCGGG